MKLHLWVNQGTQSDHVLLLVVVVVHEVFCDGLVRILLERPIVEAQSSHEAGPEGRRRSWSPGRAGVSGSMVSLNTIQF